ncbi:MAG: nucleotidyltransferase domain-containing protein [Sulfuricella sp.]
MRLQPKEVDAIVQAAREAFAPGTEVFLFGSRLQDAARGGDIDLLVETPEAMSSAELVQRRTRFISRIYRALDEQRIDVVIATQGQQDSRAVVAMAKRDGLKVAQV